MHISIVNVLIAGFAVCGFNLGVESIDPIPVTCTDADPTCDDVIDPCLNNGRCCMIDGKAVCDCSVTAGYSGGFCQERPCVPGIDPCLNGGTCTDVSGSYQCVCLPANIGLRCEYAPCDHDNCLNGGSCRAIGLNSYYCDCPKDAAGQLISHSGRHCELTPCSPSPCLNGGTCALANYATNYRCTCPKDANGKALFNGKNCEIPDPCVPDPCLNGATCVFDASKSWKYRCNPPDPLQFGGQFGNETAICARENPCLNGGTCARSAVNYPSPDSYSCACTAGWICTNCSVPNPCTQGILPSDDGNSNALVIPEELCFNGATCHPLCSRPEKYYCKCPHNFRGADCTIPIATLAGCCNDPHCRSFDGRNVEYHSACQAVLVKSCNDVTWPADIPTFQIIGAFAKCGSRIGPTCVNATAIEINGKLYEITTTLAYVDNVLTPLPIRVSNPENENGEPLLTINVEKASPTNCVSITTSWGLVITQCPNCMEVGLSYDLYDKITGKVCGLFGNANDKSADDYSGLSRGGFFAANIVSPPKPTGCDSSDARRKRDVADDLENPLLLCKDENSTMLAESVCSIINNQTGPFGGCYSKNIARTEMYKACLHDMCLDPIFKCGNLEGYAKACSKYTCYGDWRSEVNCPSVCPTGMTWSYEYNRNCQKSCFKPDPCPADPHIITNTTCGEGCVCEDDTVWNERTGLCIEASKCNDSMEWSAPPYYGKECDLIPDEENPNQLTCEIMSPEDRLLLENCGKACDCAILKMRPKTKIRKNKKKKMTVIKFKTGNVNSCFRKIAKPGKVKKDYDTSDFSEQEENFQAKCYESCGCLVENKGRRGKYNQSKFNKCFKGKAFYQRKKGFYKKWYNFKKSVTVKTFKI